MTTHGQEWKSCRSQTRRDRILRIFARCVAGAATALAVVAFGVGATSAAPPPDSCDGQWTAPSPLQFVQENGYYVTLYLNQQGTKITGKAGYQIGRKVTTGNGEALLCNLWPYWYSSTMFGAGHACQNDQYVFPPSFGPLITSDPGAARKT